MTNSNTTYTKPLIEPAHVDPSAMTKALVKAIATYQRMTAGRPSPCRFYPSCSNYAREAVLTHGALRGIGLALRRISRCRPFGPHGVDLVPVPKKTRRTQS